MKSFQGAIVDIVNNPYHPPLRCPVRILHYMNHNHLAVGGIDVDILQTKDRSKCCLNC